MKKKVAKQTEYNRRKDQKDAELGLVVVPRVKIPQRDVERARRYLTRLRTEYLRGKK